MVGWMDKIDGCLEDGWNGSVKNEWIKRMKEGRKNPVSE